MSYEDFKRVFQGADDEMESRGIGGAEGSSNFVTIPPKPIPELSDLLNQVYIHTCLFYYFFIVSSIIVRFTGIRLILICTS